MNDRSSYDSLSHRPLDSILETDGSAVSPAGANLNPRRVGIGGAIGLGLLTALIPTVIAHALLAVWFNGATVFIAPPCVGAEFNDELAYYQLMQQVAEYGLTNPATGYTAYNDMEGKSELARFGAWGPMFPAISGYFAMLFGASYATIPLLNATALIVAWVSFFLIVRPTFRASGWLIFWFACFWPVHLFVIANMQDVLHVAIAVMIAGCVSRAIMDDFVSADSQTQIRRRRFLLAAILLATAASTLRVTWALVLLPLFVMAFRGRRGGLFTAVLVWIVMFCSAYALTSCWSAPFPSMAPFAVGGKRTFSDMLLMVPNQILRNLGCFFPSGVQKRDVGVLATSIYFQAVLLVMASLAVPPYSSWREKRLKRDGSNNDCRVGPWTMSDLWIGLPILMTLFLTFAVYTTSGWRGTRAILPVVVTGVVVLPAISYGIFGRLDLRSTRYRRLFMFLIAINILCTLAFLNSIVPIHGSKFANRHPDLLEDFRAKLQLVMPFDPLTKNRWDNTVLVVRGPDSAEAQLGIPNGFGRSLFVDKGPNPFIEITPALECLPQARSKYVLVPLVPGTPWSTVDDPKSIQVVETLRTAFAWEPILEHPLGMVFRVGHRGAPLSETTK